MHSELVGGRDLGYIAEVVGKDGKTPRTLVSGIELNNIIVEFTPESWKMTTLECDQQGRQEFVIGTNAKLVPVVGEVLGDNNWEGELHLQVGYSHTQNKWVTWLGATTNDGDMVDVAEVFGEENAGSIEDELWNAMARAAASELEIKALQLTSKRDLTLPNGSKVDMFWKSYIENMRDAAVDPVIRWKRIDDALAAFETFAQMARWMGKWNIICVVAPNQSSHDHLMKNFKGNKDWNVNINDDWRGLYPLMAESRWNRVSTERSIDNDVFMMGFTAQPNGNEAEKQIRLVHEINGATYLELLEWTDKQKRLLGITLEHDRKYRVTKCIPVTQAYDGENIVLAPEAESGGFGQAVWQILPPSWLSYMKRHHSGDLSRVIE